VSREATTASSEPDGLASAALPADLPALLEQAVEALEAIAVTEPISAAAYQDAMRIAAALRQRIGESE
jgi:hypothetical protein